MIGSGVATSGPSSTLCIIIWDLEYLFQMHLSGILVGCSLSKCKNTVDCLFCKCKDFSSNLSPTLKKEEINLNKYES
jgi:hypothetical protein